MKTGSPPWASGPGEILKHGLSLLKADSDTNRRLALISIDNAVELIVKTYLGLPARVIGIRIPRAEIEDMSMSFPKLLDGLEKYCKDKMTGIDLGEIEWYHRLRNELYHNGNGLTVERARVEVYSELAKTLFAALFGAPLIEDRTKEDELLGDFMAAWINFERALQGLAVSVEDKHSIRRSPVDVLQFLLQTNQVSKADFTEINQLRRIRNEVVHGVADYKQAITKDVINRLRHYTRELERRKSNESGKG
jgi:hypothetical protein